MAYEHIVYEVENGRARITLNRPERRNALCPPLLDELERALWDADDDKRVYCVIVRGAGPAFCAGYDLSGFGRAPVDDGVPRRGMRTIDDDIWSLEKSNRRIRALWEMHKPPSSLNRQPKLVRAISFVLSSNPTAYGVKIYILKLSSNNRSKNTRYCYVGLTGFLFVWSVKISDISRLFRLNNLMRRRV